MEIYFISFLILVSDFGELLNFLNSYLSGRKQSWKLLVEVDCCNECCVPEGSVLAPLLFILFINDLSRRCTVSSPLLCADDAKLITLNLHEQFFKAELHLEPLYFERNEQNAFQCL